MSHIPIIYITSELALIRDNRASKFLANQLEYEYNSDNLPDLQVDYIDAHVGYKNWTQAEIEKIFTDNNFEILERHNGYIVVKPVKGAGHLYWKEYINTIENWVKYSKQYEDWRYLELDTATENDIDYNQALASFQMLTTGEFWGPIIANFSYGGDDIEIVRNLTKFAGTSELEEQDYFFVATNVVGDAHV